ncbi:MAG: hypothetical protein EKK46_09610 [Rhodocyclaceae bacterium]|nr:MAG: hypothetical protein EKK46_09610 [Rhodocyclaceae bacterium]
MFLMRIAGFLAVIVVAGGILCYLFTGQRRYLQLAGRVAKWALIFVLLVFGLMILERIIVL